MFARNDSSLNYPQVSQPIVHRKFKMWNNLHLHHLANQQNHFLGFKFFSMKRSAWTMPNRDDDLDRKSSVFLDITLTQLRVGGNGPVGVLAVVMIIVLIFLFHALA
jgi:hypothetical protein